MVRTLPLAVILLSCISCSTYQYSTVSSPDIKKNERNEFVVENDSLKLVYNFYGRDLGVTVSIQNKLSVPVYIDWQRSALIVNDETIRYVPAEMRLEGSYQGSSYNYGNRGSGYGVNGGQFSAVASLPSTMDFIPPRSSFTKTPVTVNRHYLDNIPEAAWHKEKFSPIEGLSVNVKKVTFTEATSPLRFRSFITYLVDDPAGKPFGLEHTFYVSEMMKSGQGPESMMLNSNYLGNQFFTSKATQGGQAGAAIGLSAIIVAGILAGHNNNNNNDGN